MIKLRQLFRSVAQVVPLWLLYCTGFLNAQLTPADPQQKILDVPTDTIRALQFISPELLYRDHGVMHDTLDAYAHHYDPAMQQPVFHATLGNLGSAGRPLYFEMPMTKGIDAGHHAYDLYKIRFSDFRFYDTDVAYTRLKYSQGLDQQDGILMARFGRNFANDINLSTSYQRINQIGRYNTQRAKNTAFGIGILYRSPGGRFDGIYHYMSNSIVKEDNGGIHDIQNLLDTIDLPRNIPVRLSGALTTHRERTLTVQHHLHLLGTTADTVARRAALDIIHTGSIGSRLIKFHDDRLTQSDSAYYASFVTDARGVRHYMYLSTVDNALDLQFRYRPVAEDIPSHMLRAGIQYRTTSVDQEPLRSDVREVFLNASGRLGISRFLMIDGFAYLGLFDAAGHWRLDGNAHLRLLKDADITGSAVLYQRTPFLTEQHFYVNQEVIWSQEFSNITASALHFSYFKPSWGMRIHGAAHLISGFIYYDSDRFPVQADQNVEVLQVVATQELRYRFLGVRGTVALQEYSFREIALPRIILHGQLYYTGMWFNEQLAVRAGLELAMTDSYRGVSYFPLTGQFYFDNDFRIPAYPAADVFFTMQVKQIFHAFFKVENITAFVARDHLFRIADYPYFEHYFRFGLRMTMFN